MDGREQRTPNCRHVLVEPDGTCLLCGVLATMFPGKAEFCVMVPRKLVDAVKNAIAGPSPVEKPSPQIIEEEERKEAAAQFKKDEAGIRAMGFLIGVYTAGWLERARRAYSPEEATPHIDSCVVCGAALLPPTTPPHCEDCHVPEEIDEDWKEKVRRAGD